MSAGSMTLLQFKNRVYDIFKAEVRLETVGSFVRFVIHNCEQAPWGNQSLLQAIGRVCPVAICQDGLS